MPLRLLCDRSYLEETTPFQARTAKGPSFQLHLPNVFEEGIAVQTRKWENSAYRNHKHMTRSWYLSRADQNAEALGREPRSVTALRGVERKSRP